MLVFLIKKGIFAITVKESGGLWWVVPHNGGSVLKGGAARCSWGNTPTALMPKAASFCLPTSDKNSAFPLSSRRDSTAVSFSSRRQRGMSSPQSCGLSRLPIQMHAPLPASSSRGQGRLNATSRGAFSCRQICSPTRISASSRMLSSRVQIRALGVGQGEVAALCG